VKKHLAKFTIALFLFAVITILITCKKEYSYEGGPPAIYTFAGAGSACTNSLVGGTYDVNDELSAGDTVQLWVHVITAGTYTINTATVDGFGFSEGGSFKDTGYQPITLIGSGTPTAAGTFTFNTNGDSSCSFTVNVIDVSAQKASYILAGEPANCTNIGVLGNYIATTAFTAGNELLVNVDVLSPGTFTITSDTLDGFYFYASGIFTATGSQVVILNGKGIPNFPANLNFKLQSDSTSCTFSVPVQNLPPLATYVIQSGGPGVACTFTAAGMYALNTPLTNADIVSIYVYVAVVGNFTISTQTVDGMTFSYTGAFTSLGNQFVNLVGSGTPAASGTFTFTPAIVGPAPLGGTACNYTIVVN